MKTLITTVHTLRLTMILFYISKCCFHSLNIFVFRMLLIIDDRLLNPLCKIDTMKTLPVPEGPFQEMIGPGMCLLVENL